MIKAIIFDFFGVIVVDGMQALIDDILADKPGDKQRVQELIMLANSGVMPVSQYGQEVTQILGISYDEYRRRITQAEVRNKPLLKYIVPLRRSYKTALLSNIGKGSLEKRFTQAELDELFDVVVASGEIGVAKPSVQAYLITAERLGVEPSECVFIDDRRKYCDGAIAVGMQAIMFESFAQCKSDLEQLGISVKA